MLKTVLAVCALLCAFTIHAEARPRHHAVSTSCVETDIMRPVCDGHPSNGFLDGVRSIRVTMHRERHAEAAPEVVGGRPAGCPHAFCGCGASLHLFGRIVPIAGYAIVDPSAG